MSPSREAEAEFVRNRYRTAFAATVAPGYADHASVAGTGGLAATLGYRRAGAEPLFLETYLDEPVEALVSGVLERRIERGSIVEIGNLAAGNAMAMMALWGTVSNDLAGASEIAVATLTAPLRAMFARIGVPLQVLAPADSARVADPAAWGSYYASDPQVCMGVIAEGQAAIASFLSLRRARIAA